MSWKYIPHQLACYAAGVHFLTLQEVDRLARDITEKVQASNFRPDVVVGILRGGYYPSKIVARNLGVPTALVDISRPRKTFFDIETDNMLFIGKILKVSKRDPRLNSPPPKLGEYNRALIIDDDCQEGKTFGLAKKILEIQGIETKQAALLVYPGKHHPDFYAQEIEPINPLIKGAKRFPWMPYSPYFERYRREIFQSHC